MQRTFTLNIHEQQKLMPLAGVPTDILLMEMFTRYPMHTVSKSSLCDFFSAFAQAMPEKKIRHHALVSVHVDSLMDAFILIAPHWDKRPDLFTLNKRILELRMLRMRKRHPLTDAVRDAVWDFTERFLAFSVVKSMVPASDGSEPLPKLALVKC